MKNRIICIAVSLLMVMVPCFAFAGTELDAPIEEGFVDKYSYTSTVSTTLTISSTGVAKPRAVITSFPGTTTKLSATMYLQKYSSGSWKTVQSWSDSSTSNSLSISKSKSVAHGKYRTHTVFKAYNNSKSEQIVKNSGTVTY